MNQHIEQGEKQTGSARRRTNLDASIDKRNDLLPQVPQVIHVLVILPLALVVAQNLLPVPPDGELPRLADVSRLEPILDGRDLAPRVPTGGDEQRRSVEDLCPGGEGKATC